jgi:hypothetical protein
LNEEFVAVGIAEANIIILYDIGMFTQFPHLFVATTLVVDATALVSESVINPFDPIDTPVGSDEPFDIAKLTGALKSPKLK